jgi:hypothetical protein
MTRLRTTPTWLMAGLLTAVILPGCGTPLRTIPTSLPVAVAARGPAVAPQAANPAWAKLAITDAVVTCSEIVVDRRPVGFHLSGHLPSGEMVTLFYNGMLPVAPGSADVDVPNDAMIARMKPLRGVFDLQLAASGSAMPASRPFTSRERQALLSAVRRTIQASPVGRNPMGQSVRIVLAMVERTLASAASGSGQLPD